MTRFLRLFQRLQWKLAVSYTIVTVGTLLVVGVLLSGTLIYFLTSDFYTRLAQRSMQNHLAKQLSPYLSQSPPDMEGVRIWTRSLLRTTTTWTGSANLVDRPALSLGSLNLMLDEHLQFYLLDRNRNVLAKVSGTGAVAFPDIQFDPTRRKGSKLLIDRALAEADPEAALFVRYEDGVSIAAAPVLGSAGERLGVILVSYLAPVLRVSTLTPLLRPLLLALGPVMLITLIVGTAFGFLSSRGFVRRLQRMSGAARAWSQGDFSERTLDSSRDEIGQLSRQLNEMATQLEGLVTAQQELAATEERNRLARELHDTVKQKMFAISMQLGAAKSFLSTNTPSAAGHLSRAEELTRLAQRELTALVNELRPVLQGREVGQTLRDYVEDWSRQTDIRATVSIREVNLDTLSPSQSETLLRVAQEALSNVARHSEARKVDVQVHELEGKVCLSVHDDGKGFDGLSTRIQKGIGIQSMKERLAQVAGELRIQSTRERGTEIVAVIPAPRREAGS